ncbi:hypothetical protein MPTK2_4g23260 [Marchantia polymorpha subsp. ruderalis]
MDVKIWSQLHAHDGLLEMILARLPMQNLVQLKIVCKQWKSLIDSPYFSMIRRKVPNSVKTNFLLLELVYRFGRIKNMEWISNPLYLCADNVNCTKVQIYNPLLNRWYSRPVSFLKSTNKKFFLQSRHKEWHLLYVGVTKHPEASGLLVCRPSSESISEISPSSDLIVMPNLKGILSLAVDEETSSFTLISVAMHCSERGCPCREIVSLHTELFDSVSKQWKAGPCFHTDLKVKPCVQCIAMPIAIGHCVYYFLSSGHLQDWIGEFESSAELQNWDFDVEWNGPHLSFDWKENSWKVLAGNLPQGLATFQNITMFERDGSLVLAELTRTEDADWRTSLGWKPRIYSWNPSITPDSIIWTEIPVSVPPNEEDFQELFHHQKGRRYVGSWNGQGDHIIFLSSLFWSHRALVYNMTTRKWTVTVFTSEGPTTSEVKRFIPVPTATF